MALARFANVAPNPILPLFVQRLGDTPERLGATGVASTLSAPRRPMLTPLLVTAPRDHCLGVCARLVASCCELSAAARSASSDFTRAMVAVVGLPGPNTARTPSAFNGATSSSGI